MSSLSSFVPRLRFSVNGPILPVHNRKSPPPVRKKPSEYSLTELAPYPDDADILLPARPDSASHTHHRQLSRRSPSPTPSRRHHGYDDDDGDDDGIRRGSPRPKPKEPVLFAGPPPPIARSMVLYRDQEDRDASTRSSPGPAASLARNINSVLFDRLVPSASGRSSRDPDFDPKPDPVWVTLQRRERALQREIQFLLDAQSAGLAANLDPQGPSPSRGRPSRSSTPTAASSSSFSASTSSRRNNNSNSNINNHRTTKAGHSRRVSFDPDLTSPTTTSSGTPIPVRQPRPQPPTLRSARAGLARAMAALLELRADEDAALAAALAARRQALAQLRRWAARRESVARELKALEAGEEGSDGEDCGKDGAASSSSLPGGDPLARELRALRAERERVRREVEELEGRLRAAKLRGRELDGRIREAESKRESGLSGYRWALREVEERIEALLTRPGVRPLDVGVLGPLGRREEEDGEKEEEEEGGVAMEESPGGVEFLRLRPERRTVEMARDWWEAEVAILERRKAEVDRERAALEEGAEVWQRAVRMVSEFEAALRREMSGGDDGGGGGGGKSSRSSSSSSTSASSPQQLPSASPSSAPSTPEQVMLAQLDKMRTVISGLADLLRISEDRGWNLLICAIGAEFEAFRQADRMLRDVLRAAGVHVPPAPDEDARDESGRDGGAVGSGGDGTDADGADELTPRMGRSVNLSRSAAAAAAAAAVATAGSGSGGSGGNLVDLDDPAAPARERRRRGHDLESSDNEVPPDLLAAADSDEADDEEQDHGRRGRRPDHGLLSSSPPPPPLSRESSNNEVPPEFLGGARREGGRGQGGGGGVSWGVWEVR
ncbi:hypothetical protein VTJ83DRAFT_3279 [Remersonia thermophila]|uniref:Autophagy-related protein 28 n=1 Tax=Remersonia thermophila TaxID=72144 RepID=A0ABR4DDK0_9PEZI